MPPFSPPRCPRRRAAEKCGLGARGAGQCMKRPRPSGSGPSSGPARSGRRRPKRHPPARKRQRGHAPASAKGRGGVRRSSDTKCVARARPSTKPTESNQRSLGTAVRKWMDIIRRPTRGNQASGSRCVARPLAVNSTAVFGDKGGLRRGSSAAPLASCAPFCPAPLRDLRPPGTKSYTVHWACQGRHPLWSS